MAAVAEVNNNHVNRGADHAGCEVNHDAVLAFKHVVCEHWTNDRAYAVAQEQDFGCCNNLSFGQCSATVCDGNRVEANTAAPSTNREPAITT